MKNIFVSYAWDKENDEKVIKLAEMLEEYKELNVKFDKWDINKGQEIPLFMEKGIQQSDFVLVICSKVKSRLLCKMLYNVFTISTYQN